MAWTVDGLSYSYRKLVTPTRPGAALTSYPLKVGIVADTDIGARCLASGNDLRFTLTDGTLLYAEKDGFAVAAGAATGVFWVNVPSLASASDTPIYCYYGNAGAGVQTGATSVWSATHEIVYHMGEASGNAADATGNAHTGVGNGSIAYEQAGQVGKAMGFSKDSMTYLQTDYTIPTTDFTVAFWAQASEGGIAARPIGAADYGAGANGVAVIWNLGGVSYIYAALRSGGSSYDIVALAPGLLSGLHLIAITVDSTAGAVLYYDGGPLGTSPTCTAIGTGGLQMRVGVDANQVIPGFGGLIDEFRFAESALSSQWLAYDYLTQSTAAGGLTWGPQQVAASGIRRFNPYVSPGTNPGWM